MKLYRGDPCPITALLKKTLCLGDTCPWYLPDFEGCVVRALSTRAGMLSAAFEQLAAKQDSIGHIEENVDAILASIQKRQEEEQID